MGRLLIVFSIFLLASCGGGGGSSTPPPVTGGGGGSNSAPSITSATDFTFAENEIIEFVITVNDPDGDDVTVTPSAAGDGALFNFDSTGFFTVIPNNGSLDFENPLDGNMDNVYEQALTLSDGTNTVNDTIRITITDVDEPPMCMSGQNVAFNEEFTGEIFDFAGSDPEGEAGTHAITRIEAINFFGLSDTYRDALSVDPVTGVLSVTTPLDAETEGTDYLVEVTVEYTAGGLVGACAVTLQLTDVVGRVTSGYRLTGNQLAAEFVGDLNQDGFSETWIPTTVDDGVFRQPSGYLLLGSAVNTDLADDGVGDVDLSALTATEAIRIFVDLPEVSTQGGNLLRAQAVGDLDADGFDELLLGLVPTGDSQTDVLDADVPLAYLLWGNALINDTDGEIDLGALTPGDGVVINADLPADAFTRSRRGLSLAAGNFDGDALTDIAISAPELAPASNINGVLYILFDEVLLAAQAAGTLSLHENNTVAAFTESSGNAFSGVGFDLSVLRDIDADTFDEIAIAANFDELGVLMGSDIQSAVTNDYTFYSSLNAFAGLKRYTVTGSGMEFNKQSFDVNGDGVSDLLVSTSQDAVLIDGQDIAGTTAVTPINLVRSSASSLRGVESLGDIDGDTFDDFVIGKQLVLGQAINNLAGSSIELDALAAGDGLTILPVNPADVTSLRSISAVQDVDGDNIADLLITQYLEDGTGTKEDQTFIVKSSDIVTALDSGGTELELADLFDDESAP